MALNSKQQIVWSNEKRKLSDLIPWERNPRQIKDKQAKLLAESFNDFGQVETIAISAKHFWLICFGLEPQRKSLRFLMAVLSN